MKLERIFKIILFLVFSFYFTGLNIKGAIKRKVDLVDCNSDNMKSLRKQYMQKTNYKTRMRVDMPRSSKTVDYKKSKIDKSKNLFTYTEKMMIDMCAKKAKEEKKKNKRKKNKRNKKKKKNNDKKKNKNDNGKRKKKNNNDNNRKKQKNKDVKNKNNNNSKKENNGNYVEKNNNNKDQKNKNNGKDEKNNNKNEKNNKMKKVKSAGNKKKINVKKTVELFKKFKKSKVLKFLKKVKSTTTKIAKTKGQSVLILLAVIPDALELFNEYIILSNTVRDEIQNIIDFFSSINNALDNTLENVLRNIFKLALFLSRNDENKEKIDNIIKLIDLYYDTDFFETLLIDILIEKVAKYIEDNAENENTVTDINDILDNENVILSNNDRNKNLETYTTEEFYYATSDIKENLLNDINTEGLIISLNDKLEEMLVDFENQDNNTTEPTKQTDTNKDLETTPPTVVKSLKCKIDKINNNINKLLEKSTQLGSFKNLFGLEMIEFISSNIEKINFIEELTDENEESYEELTDENEESYEELTDENEEGYEELTDENEESYDELTDENEEGYEGSNEGSNEENNNKSNKEDINKIQEDITHQASATNSKEEYISNNNKIKSTDEYYNITRPIKTNLTQNDSYEINPISKKDIKNIEITKEITSNDKQHDNSIIKNVVYDSIYYDTTINPDVTHLDARNKFKNKIEYSVYKLLILFSYKNIKNKNQGYKKEQIYFLFQNEIKKFQKNIYYNFYNNVIEMPNQKNFNEKRTMTNQNPLKETKENQFAKNEKMKNNDKTLKMDKDEGKNKIINENKMDFVSFNSKLNENHENNYYRIEIDSNKDNNLANMDQNELTTDNEEKDRKISFLLLQHNLQKDEYNLLKSINPSDISYYDVIKDGYKLIEKITTLNTFLTTDEENFILLIYSFINFRLNDTKNQDKNIDNFITLFDKFNSILTMAMCNKYFHVFNSDSEENGYDCLGDIETIRKKLLINFQINN